MFALGSLPPHFRASQTEEQEEGHNIHEVTTNGLATTGLEQKSKSESNAAKAAGNMVAKR